MQSRSIKKISAVVLILLQVFFISGELSHHTHHLESHHSDVIKTINCSYGFQGHNEIIIPSSNGSNHTCCCGIEFSDNRYLEIKSISTYKSNLFIKDIGSSDYLVIEKSQPISIPVEVTLPNYYIYNLTPDRAPPLA
ncbi:MAG: hypothetical protein KKA84_10455 [Bacteroidetes bacterium]|nr:hypothetical protein [Bacteroidota bacterium]